MPSPIKTHQTRHMKFTSTFQDRAEHKNAQKRATQTKADIDDTKENVMDDLLSALASSGAANQVRLHVHLYFILPFSFWVFTLE